MEGQEEKKVEKTWKPTTAGILAIISGVIGCIYSVVVAIIGGITGGALSVFGLGALGGIIVAVGVILLILGVIAIVGGAAAMKRKSWGLALAGSICALFSPVGILGILAIIFVALGKSEFR